MRLSAGLHVCLQRWLSVEVDSEVDDVAALHEAEWWCVGPSAGYIYAHGRASPYNLVGIHRQLWALLYAQCLGGESLAQQRERCCFVLLSLLAALCTAIRALAFGFRAEHGVAGACQERSRLG